MATDDGAAQKPSLSKIIADLEKALPWLPQHKLLEMAQEAIADDGDGDDSDTADDAAADASGASDMNDDAGAGDDDGESEDEMMARHREELSRCANDSERAEMAKKHQSERAKRDEARAGRRVNREREAHHSARRTERMVERLIARHPMMIAAHRTISEIRGNQAKADAEKLVDGAIRDGRLIPAQRDWALAYCASDRGGFEKFIGVSPVFVKSGADGSFTAHPAGEGADKSLARHEMAVCSRLGITGEQYLKAKKDRLSVDAAV